jgi:hypothetical protein
MRKFLILALVIGVAGIAAAYDLGTQAPVKSPVAYPENIPDPARQGGDTTWSALVIPGLPYNDSGTTTGYTDDYDEVCPYDGSHAPDVVYRYTPSCAQAVTIDLCNSNFDTKLYIYDSVLNLIACNDDFYFGAPCFVYSSRLENVALAAGQTYYIVIDGYGNASGAYTFEIPCGCPPCVVPCPADASTEGEPGLVPDYVDLWNGGCNTSPSFPFQHIAGALGGSTIPVGSAVFCGVSGWYLNQGGNSRDTDWFTLTVGDGGSVGITADAEYASYIFELTGACDGSVAVAQQATAGPCAQTTMTIAGDPGAEKWFWVGPTVFVAPSWDTSYDYAVWFTGLAPEVIATEPTTWGALKALYD